MPHLTRRAFCAGLITAPAMVRATSLDYIPKHRYYAYIERELGDCFDIVRSDGQFMGMIFEQDIRNLGIKSTSALVHHAQSEFVENHARLHEALKESAAYSSIVPAAMIL